MKELLFQEQKDCRKFCGDSGKCDNDYGIYKRCIIPFKKEDDEKENSDYLKRMENKFKMAPVIRNTDYTLILEYLKYKENVRQE